MPRQLRIEYPGAIYQVMNRGDRREPIARHLRGETTVTLKWIAEELKIGHGHICRTTSLDVAGERRSEPCVMLRTDPFLTPFGKCGIGAE